MVPSEFVKFIAEAAPGKQAVYYTGNLAKARTRYEKGDVEARQRAKAIDELAEAAWQAKVRGDVILTQRRIAPDCYEYIAIKTAVPFVNGVKALFKERVAG